MNAQIVRTVRLVGIVVFVVAFFLPAIQGDNASGPGSGTQVGWVCALIAAAATGGIFHPTAAWEGKEMVGAVALIFSGWLNPFVLFYLVFSFWPRFIAIRRVLAIAVTVCLVATWVFFVKATMVPLIGHYLWAAGALMIVAGAFVPRPSPEPKAGAAGI